MRRVDPVRNRSGNRRWEDLSELCAMWLLIPGAALAILAESEPLGEESDPGVLPRIRGAAGMCAFGVNTVVETNDA